MRIAIDATPLVGIATGVATFVRGALAALSTRDDVEVVGFGLTGRGHRALRSSLPDRAAGTSRPMPASLLTRLWLHADIPPIEWWTGEVDVVHGTNFVVPPARHAGRVVTVHDLTAVRFPELCTKQSLRYPELIRRAADKGAWVHTPSRAVAEEVIELLRVPRERVRPTLSGVDLEGLRRGSADRGTALARSRRYVLALGTVEPRKDYPALVRAFDIAAEDRPDLQLVIAGPDGWGARQLTAALVSARHRDRILRLGWIEDQARADLLSGAIALVMPSVYEGFGYPGLEAMAVGTPVIATSVGALPEVLGDAALLVDAGDVVELAGAIASVADDESIAARLRRLGPEWAATFTWKRWADQAMELYRDASSGRG